MCRCFCRRRSRGGGRWRGRLRSFWCGGGGVVAGGGQVARALAEFLVRRVQSDRGEDDASMRAGMLIASVNGVAVAESVMAWALLDAGFVAGGMGFNVRRLPTAPGASRVRERTA